VLGRKWRNLCIGLFYLEKRGFLLDRDHIQTLMVLKLSIAGHLTNLLTTYKQDRSGRFVPQDSNGFARSRTQALAHGDRRPMVFFMTTLGWGWGTVSFGATHWFGFLVNEPREA